jgi:hypothetical protein
MWLCDALIVTGGVPLKTLTMVGNAMNVVVWITVTTGTVIT